MKSIDRVCIALLCVACGGEVGTVQIEASGEEAAVSGFPVEDGPAFVDGWSLTFDTLVVSLTGIELRGADGEVAPVDVEPVLVDLSAGDRALWTLEGVPARRWEDVRYELAPATAASVDAGPVDAAVRQRMVDEGLSVYLEATAERAGETRTLAWGFALDVLNRGCVAGDGTDGIVVPAGGVAQGQMTLHWDHLFFDSLRLDDAEMRFDAMAAVAEPDGSIPLENLRMQRLADLRDADGEPLLDEAGAPLVYDPGSTPLEEPTLFHMVRVAATTIGHWNGEGHCDYEVR
jgi:hypothetical protein